MWVLWKVRENGRAECPVPQVPFPLLVAWDALLATPTSFSEATPLTDGPTGIFPGKPPTGRMLLEGGRGLSSSGFGMAPYLFTPARWREQRGRGELRKGRLQQPNLPSVFPLPPYNLPSASQLPPQLHNP